MPYKNLSQLQALSKSVGIKVRIEERPYPVYQGKLTSIDAEGLAKHASEVQEWQSVLMNQIRKIGDDLGDQLAVIQANPPVVNCTTLPGLKGDKGDSVKGDRGADGSPGSTVLFDHFTDVVYSDTSNQQNLYGDIIPENTLSKDGDKIFAKYSGSWLAGEVINETSIGIIFNGVKLLGTFGLAFDYFVPDTAAVFEINVFIIRESSTAFRASVTIQTDAGLADPVVYPEMSLTLTTAADFTIPITLAFYANSLDSGAVTASMATGWFMPAA